MAESKKAPETAEQVAGQEAMAALKEQNRMRDYFAAQKKVSIKTRQDEWVQINGYTFIIKGGERVEVPEDVANLLEESGRI
jgi:hypothetical protein